VHRGTECKAGGYRYSSQPTPPDPTYRYRRGPSDPIVAVARLASGRGVEPTHFGYVKRVDGKESIEGQKRLQNVSGAARHCFNPLVPWICG
jgi:hypothetical protein